MSENFLKEIPLESLESLRDFYKINWPEHIVAYNFVDNMLKKSKNHNEDYRELFNIFSHDGKVENDATFVGNLFVKELVLSSLDPTFEKLGKLLKHFDFSIPRHILCTREIYRKSVLDYISKNSLDMLWDDETVLVYLSKEEALKLNYEVPEGFELRSLSSKDVKIVQHHWAYAPNMSQNFAENSIKFNPSVGIYDKNELVSWCICTDFGLLMSLFTIQSHRRKGYAEIVIKAISKKVAESNSDVVACVAINNRASLNLFTNFGFKIIDRNYFIVVEKKSE